MDIFTLIRSRESIRSYDPGRKVPEDTLRTILDAGRLAPSAANRQPWRFIVVSSEVMLSRIRACYAAKWFQDAPHVLIVTGNREHAWTRAADGYSSLETDLTIAMDHMILAAEASGVATCWIAAFDPAKLQQALELSRFEAVYAMSPLGFPPSGFKKREKKDRRPLSDVAMFLYAPPLRLRTRQS